MWTLLLKMIVWYSNSQLCNTFLVKMQTKTFAGAFFGGPFLGGPFLAGSFFSGAAAFGAATGGGAAGAPPPPPPPGVAEISALSHCSLTFKDKKMEKE